MMKYATLAARLLIGGLFIYASIHKVWDPASFAVSIRNYMIVPASWSNLIALTLPWIELSAGIFLILGIQTRASALLTTVMLGVFLGALFYAFSIGLDINCGCFTSGAASEGHIGPYYLVRDSGLFLISLFMLVSERGNFSIANVPILNGRLRLLNA